MSSKADINSDDYYKVLGVERDSSDAKLAKAYKKLALKHHPDKNPNRKAEAEEEFKRINEAYDVLRCAEKRKVYDQCGKEGANAGNPQSGEPNFYFKPGSGSGQTSMSREEADMLFSTFFGGSDQFGNMFGGGACTGSPFMFQSMGHGGSVSGFSPFDSNDNAFSGMNFTGTFPGGAQPRSRDRSRRAPGRHQEGSDPCAIPSGTPVIIKGLAKSPEHNGKTGHIVGWDHHKARYDVQLTSGCTMSLRLSNITQLCRMEVSGLASKPELNGKPGKISDYDMSKCRYTILVDGPGIAVSVQPSSCILSAGTRVVISGLSKSECNGQRACIVSIDREADRYTVKCESGKHIKIKYGNVLC